MTTRHIVALSGGKDSTAMALRLRELEPRDYEYICTPTGNELPAMFAHWRSLSDLLKTQVKPIMPSSLKAEILRQNHIPNWRQRWCTRTLKIQPFEAYLLRCVNEGDDVIAYVGLRADESVDEREGAVYKDIRLRQRWPLREWGWGIGDVWAYLDAKGVSIPERTDCAWCFFQTLGEWWALWYHHPDIYAEAEKIEAIVGHTFRSDGRDTWPAGLAALRARFERGDRPRGAGMPRLMDSRPIMCSACAR